MTYRIIVSVHHHYSSCHYHIIMVSLHYHIQCYVCCALSLTGLWVVCAMIYSINISVCFHTIMVNVDYNTITVSVHCDLTTLGIVCTITYSCMVSEHNHIQHYV